MFPKFYVVDSIDAGDLDILFEDYVSKELCEIVKSEINNIMPTLSSKNRTPQHLENMVKGIFSKMAIWGCLDRDPARNSWGLRKHVR